MPKPLKGTCPYCGKNGTQQPVVDHPDADFTWRGQPVACGNCGCEFVLNQSDPPPPDVQDDQGDNQN